MNCVDFFLEDHVDRQKDFVLGRSHVLSYSMLIEGVLKLAAWLNEELGEKENIALLMPNSHHSVMAYLAIMKSGNVVVPLNPAIEKDSFDEIISRCDAKLVIAANQIIKRLQPQISMLLNETDLDRIIVNESAVQWHNSSTQSSDLAQIIFTSGSTASPKGVMISHQNIIANTSSIIEYLELTEDDIIEIVLPFFYCYGLSLLHTHLKVGGSIVLNNTFIFLNSVMDDLETYRCTGFAGVPSHFQILLRKSDSFKKRLLPHLKYVTQAGGKLHSTFIKEFCDNRPDTKFFVMYGQTEATARLSYLPPDRLTDKLGSLGKGIPNVELKVVNDYGLDVKPGEVGEIIAKGDNVMLGYYQEQEETNKIIRDGWLYTGDLASVDEDGFIYHAARRKEIIKVGGRRVSPKEIEEVIVGIDGVVDCTIEAIADEVLGEAIKAVVVVANDRPDITEVYVKSICAERLSSYKIPQCVEFTNKLNVNAAGKKVKPV